MLTLYHIPPIPTPLLTSSLPLSETDIPHRLALSTVELTHNTPLYTDIRQRLYQATGDPNYSPDSEEAVAFVSATNRKAAIKVGYLK